MQEGCLGTDNDFPKIQIERKMTVINVTYSPFPITHLQPVFSSDLYIKVAPWCLHFYCGPVVVRRKHEGTQISVGNTQLCKKQSLLSTNRQILT